MNETVQEMSKLRGEISYQAERGTPDFYPDQNCCRAGKEQSRCALQCL
jgi:hypothetical protein